MAGMDERASCQPDQYGDNCLATAKINPNSPTVTKKGDGSINGEDSHNAITADNGGPATNNAAMKGITSQEQKWDRLTTMDAKTIIFTLFP